MQYNLKMNDNKTEFIYFGGSRQLKKCFINQINLNGEMIPRSHITRYLGAYRNSVLNFKEHIKIKCKTAMLNLLKIKATRKFLTKKASSRVVIALVMSHLDYANSILVGLPKTSINLLQRVQNMVAKIVLGKTNMKAPQSAQKNCIGCQHSTGSTSKSKH